ncbi:YlbD family protein [Heyndrickxia acidiproducens]|uniref:YlbD family protein n=1 Tax=Heyndrickxia acidiproducens TaxID=1121084 RepID=UPI000364C9CA|nr:YlbD family protein [Heyndrickxia acidiproducens]
MNSKKLHPSVEKFKTFAKSHPLMMKEVRSGNKTLQDFFEEWYILGEDDPAWKKYEAAGGVEEKQKAKADSGWLNQLGTVMQKLDAGQVQAYLQNLSAAIGAIQGALSQFQSPSAGPNPNPNSEQQAAPKNPFSFRKD